MKVTYKLKVPLTIGSREIRELEVTKPTAKAMKAFKSVDLGEFNTQIKVVSVCTGEHEPIVEILDLDDFKGVANMIEDWINRAYENKPTIESGKSKQTYELKVPFVRGENEVTELEVSKPNAGIMKSYKLADLADVRTQIKLVSACSVKDESIAEKLDLDDFAGVLNLIIAWFLAAAENRPSIQGASVS